MSGAGEVVQVEVRTLQIKGGARVGEDLAVLGEWKDYCHTGRFACEAFHARNVNATFHETVHTEFAKRVAPDTRSEAYTAAQEREIVGKDCRRAAQSHGEIFGQMFALWFEHGRKTVQNQIAIEFAYDAYVKTLH